jgi:hypothetical protein
MDRDATKELETTEAAEAAASSASRPPSQPKYICGASFDSSCQAEIVADGPNGEIRIVSF